jgi:rod shape-determining protein MreD
VKRVKFADNKNLYIRRALFIGLLALTAVFQHTKGAVPSVFGARAFLLIPLAVCIAMNERSLGGLSFGLLAGVLWDFATVRGDGFYAIMLTLAGFTAGAATVYLMRNNIFSALLLSAGASLFVSVGYWFVFIILKGYEGAWNILFSFYIPSAIYTLAFTALYYYLVRFIVKATTDKKQIRKY